MSKLVITALQKYLDEVEKAGDNPKLAAEIAEALAIEQTVGFPPQPGHTPAMLTYDVHHEHFDNGDDQDVEVGFEDGDRYFERESLACDRCFVSASTDDVMKEHASLGATFVWNVGIDDEDNVKCLPGITELEHDDRHSDYILVPVIDRVVTLKIGPVELNIKTLPNGVELNIDDEFSKVLTFDMGKENR